jgi:hypothetical protein
MLCPLRAVDIAWSTASTTFVIASPRAGSPVFVVSSSRVTTQIQAFEFSSSKMTYCLPRYSIAKPGWNLCHWGRAFEDGWTKPIFVGHETILKHSGLILSSLTQCSLAKFFETQFGIARAIMNFKSHRIGIGARFKMSKLGAARCQELANQTGVVVAMSRRTTGVTVHFDGARRPTVLHEDYISPEQD